MRDKGDGKLLNHDQDSVKVAGKKGTSVAHGLYGMVLFYD